MFNSLFVWVLNQSKWIISFVLLLTLFAGFFVYHNISINTSNTDLLSKELLFRQNEKIFKEEFPQFSNNIMVVIDAKKSDVAKDIASKMYSEIKKQEGKLFTDIFYPNELDFFKKNGLLYLSEEELEKWLDQIVNYQPFISRLAESPSLYGLLSTIDLFLLVDLNDQHIDRLNKLLGKIFDINSTAVAWGDFFSDNEKPNNREIIYLQPKLDFTNFFPSEKTLFFLKQKIKNIDNEHWDNFNIRLTGTAPMEHDELSTLGKDAKIGITISLILVLLFIGFALRNLTLIFVSFLTLIIGLIWTTAFALLFFQELNLISIAFAILFIGLGIDFSIHYCLRFLEFLKKKSEHSKRLLINSTNSIVKALFLTAFATAIGFFSFAFTSFQGVAQLGIIAGTGMFVSFFLTVFFLPCLLIARKNNSPSCFASYKEGTDINYFQFMLFFKKNSKIFFTLAIFFLIFSLFNLKNIEFNDDPLKLRNPDSISVTTMNELIANKDVDYHSVDILVSDFSKSNELKNKLLVLDEIEEVNLFKDLIPEKQNEKLEILDQFKTFYPKINMQESQKLSSKSFEEQKTTVLNMVESIKSKIDKQYQSKINTNFIDQLKDNFESGEITNLEELKKLEGKYFYFFKKNIKKLNDSFEANKITENNIPNSLKSRYIGKNGKIRVEVVPSYNLDNQKNKKRFVDQVFTISPNVSGGAFTTFEAGNAVVTSFKKAMIISICSTTLFLFVVLRNFKKIFIIFINLFTSLLFSLSFLILFGLNLNFANIIALPLLFGLGAATSIQTVLRIEKFETLEKYFKTSTPRAIIFSLLTTLATFCILSFSSHLGTSSMGQLLIISILSIFLSNLTVLLPMEKYFFKK